MTVVNDGLGRESLRRIGVKGRLPGQLIGHLSRLTLLIVIVALSACGPGSTALLETTPTIGPSPPTATSTFTPALSPAQATVGPTATSTSLPEIPSSPTPIPCPERVLIISADGLRPDALTPNRTPYMLALAERGAYSWQAQTVVPSATLPAHASMLSGYKVNNHGIGWNDYIPEKGFIRSATLFSIAHKHGLQTTMLVGKKKLIHIAKPGTVDDFDFYWVSDTAMAEKAIKRIEDGFEVMFVHLRQPDAAGHHSGWMTPGYFRTVGRTDLAVGVILSALRESGLESSTLVILTADHGGHNKAHGSRRPEDMTIPWITAGPGVRSGLELGSEIRVFDTTATAAWALGLPLPADMDGSPVLDAFVAGFEQVCTWQAAAIPYSLPAALEGAFLDS